MILRDSNTERFNGMVFVIGTGRCGSRLLVDILESNYRFKSYYSEANELWHPKSYPFKKRSIETPSVIEDVNGFTKKSIENWDIGHENMIVDTFRTKMRFTDCDFYIVRSMTVLFMIKKLREMFPESKFVHILRNGLAVTESFFHKEWGKYSDYFDNKREYILGRARNWKDCIMEAEKIKNEMKDEFLEIKYEDLCDSFESSINRIAMFFKVRRENFCFNEKKISNRNNKIKRFNFKIRKDIEEVMYPALRLKGYAK